MIELWEHQAAAAERIRRNEIQGLWWEMRTGKTLATIAGTDDGDRLIVCPNSVKAVWQEDLKKWGQESYIYNSGKVPNKRPRNVIVNYESLWRTDLLKMGYDSLIFDESLRLQNPRTKLWKHITEHMPQVAACKRVIVLSGTPCPEGYHQLLTQCVVATGEYCGHTDVWNALRAFFVYDDQQHKWKIQPGHKAQALKQLHAIGPCLTQVEAGITTKKLYRMIPVEYGVLEREIWDGIGDVEEPTLSMYAQSCASGRSIQLGITESSAKLNAVAQYVTELNHPCVILCHFTSSLEYLETKLHMQLPCATIHGGDKGAAYRARTIKEFNEGKLQCLICNVATVKTGLNLSTADTLIFAENSWSGEARIQAEERCTVMGKSAIEIVDFVTIGDGDLGTIDSEILAAVRAKKDFNAKSKGATHA